MPLTNFDPGGARGFPMIGAGLGYGWKKDSNVYFVDGTQGSDGNPGDDPDSPFATIEKAITALTAYDVVYIMEKSFSGTDPTTYAGAAANHTIAFADLGCAFVGVSHAGMVGYPMTPYIMGMAATLTPIFTVNAPLCAFENLHLSGGWGNSTTATVGIYAGDTIDATQSAQGLSIFNCSFEDLEGNTPTMSRTTPPTGGGGIHIHGTWYSLVNHCRFRNCVVGVTIVSGTNTSVTNTVENCVFYADADTDVNVDVSVYCLGLANVAILNNYFAHLLPNYGSGDSKRFVYVAGGSEGGMIANNHCGDDATQSAGAAGTGIICPTTMGVSANYCECALMGAG